MSKKDANLFFTASASPAITIILLFSIANSKYFEYDTYGDRLFNYGRNAI